MSVCSTSPVSSYSSLTRQHLAQPSQSDSHSWRFICDSVLRRQNGRAGSAGATLLEAALLELLADRLGDVIGFGIHAEVTEIVPVGPHQIDDGRVVHGVVRPVADLVVVDSVCLGHAGDI